MATVVLGAVGAAIGAIKGGPKGAQMGWAIGSTIGGILEASNKPSVKTEVGKLTDLRYSGSNYGAAIPRIWGTNKVSGNIIWVANYLNNTTLVPSGTADAKHLIEHSETTSNGGGGSGGGGGGSTTSFWYSASYAVAFCAASTFKDDGSFSNRNPVIKRIWANDVLIYDVDTPANNKVTIRFHYGGETENPDTLIQSAEGAGNTPAYRGLVYIVIQDHSLKDLGNQLPNIVAEIATDTVNVEDICEDICGQVNLYGSRIDFSAATALVKGYTVTNMGSAQTLMEPLLSTFATDAVEVDGKLKLLPRGSASVVTISNDEIGAVNEGQTHGNGYSKTVGVRSELPGKVDITYFDIDKKFQQVTQSDVKQSADFGNPTSLSLSITMTADEARQTAARVIDSAYLEKDPITILLSHKYRYLSAGDPITISYNKFSYDAGRFRILKISETPGENITVTCVKDELASLTQVITGSPGTGGGTDNNTAPVPCTFYAWSGTELREQDRQSSGFYVCATWETNGQGGACYYSTDAGTTWTYGGYIGTRTPFGSSSTALANGSGFNVWDNTNTVNISITNDGLTTLSGTTDAGVLNGTNIALLGGEIIGFKTATLLSPFAYQLSGIRRGIRSSPYTGHTTSDKFVVVSSSVLRIALAETYVGTSVRVKVIAPGQVLADVTHQSVTIIARNPSDLETRVTIIDSPKADNTFYAGPVSGGPTAPTFRAINGADLPVFNYTTKGAVPAPGGSGTTKFLREDGTWQTAGGGTTYTFLSEINGSFKYYAKAIQGSSSSSSVWRVWRRHTVTQVITKADGDDLYDNVGVNMHTLSYS